MGSDSSSGGGSIAVVGGGIGGLTAACPCSAPVSTSTCTSGRRAGGGGCRRPGQSERLACVARSGARRAAGSNRGQAAGVAPASLGGWPHAAAHPIGRAAGGDVRLPALPDAPGGPVGCAGVGVPAARLHLDHRLVEIDRPGRSRPGPLRERRPNRGGRRWSVPMGSTPASAEHSLGPDEARVHRLCRLSGPGSGRAVARAAAGGDGPGVDGTGPALRPLLRAPASASSTSSPSSSRTAGRVSPGRTAVRWPRRSPPSKAGTRRSGRSCGPSTRPTSGRCSTVRPWRAGRSAG